MQNTHSTTLHRLNINLKLKTELLSPFCIINCDSNYSQPRWGCEKSPISKWWETIWFWGASQSSSFHFHLLSLPTTLTSIWKVSPRSCCRRRRHRRCRHASYLLYDRDSSRWKQVIKECIFEDSSSLQCLPGMLLNCSRTIPRTRATFTWWKFI